MQDIISRIPPIYPQWINNEGKVIDSIPGGVKPGQTMPLRLEVLIEEGKKQATLKAKNAT